MSRKRSREATQRRHRPEGSCPRGEPLSIGPCIAIEAGHLTLNVVCGVRAPGELATLVPADMVGNLARIRGTSWNVSGQKISGRPALLMTRSVATEIIEKLTAVPPEAGGALVGPQGHPIVTHFVFDEGAEVTPTSYHVDHVFLNDYLRRSREFRLEVKGLVHSHPDGHPTPSSGDIAYVERAFANPSNNIGEYLFPIVCGGVLHAHIFQATPSSSVGFRRRRRPVLSQADLILV